MSLKLIPNESLPVERKKHTMAFNPGNAIKKEGGDSFSFKELCLRLIHFVNRGSKYSLQQVDDIIVSLQHGVLKLQKKKQEILHQKIKRKKRKN